MRAFIAILLAIAFANFAVAQQSAPSNQPADQSSAPSAATPAPDQVAPAAGHERAGGRKPNPRRAACMQKARQQGLSGSQLKDSVQLCVQEARLACTKQAIQKQLAAQERREFMKNCAG